MKPVKKSGGNRRMCYPDKLPARAGETFCRASGMRGASPLEWSDMASSR